MIIVGKGPMKQKKVEITMKLSARNQLQGIIKSIKPGAVMAEVVVELPGGQEIVSVITQGAAQELNLQVGDTVVAVVKSTEVMIGRP
jgi:molybdopterin-binding protein